MMFNRIKYILWKIAYVNILLLCTGWNAQSVDLSQHVSNTSVSPIELQWHNSSTPTASTKLNSTIVSGTTSAVSYWAFFYDTINNCYSPGSKIIVIAVDCITNTANLASLSTSNAPSGSILQWHTANTGFEQSGAGQTLITNPSAVIPGTYYPVFFDNVNNCYSPSGTPVIVTKGNNCLKNVTNICPETTYNLSTLSVTPTAPAGSALQWHTVNSNFVQSGMGQTLVTNPTAVSAGTYYPVFYDSSNGCYSPSGSGVKVTIVDCGSCYKPGIIDAGNTYPTKHGITAMGRAGENNSNWPMVRESAWTVLEAKTKGFVINRIKTTAEVNAIPQPVEGMTVYDVEADCLKIYTSKDNGATFGWYCFTTPACPD